MSSRESVSGSSAPGCRPTTTQKRLDAGEGSLSGSFLSPATVWDGSQELTKVRETWVPRLTKVRTVSGRGLTCSAPSCRRVRAAGRCSGILTGQAVRSTCSTWVTQCGRAGSVAGPWRMWTSKVSGPAIQTSRAAHRIGIRRVPAALKDAITRCPVASCRRSTDEAVTSATRGPSPTRTRLATGTSDVISPQMWLSAESETGSWAIEISQG